MQGTRTWLFVLGAIFLCVLLVGVVLVYSAYAAPGGAPPRPLVTITGTLPQGTAIAGQPVTIFGEASDPSGIAGVELWVNGAKTAAQDNPDTSTSLAFETSQAWIPNGAGNYLVILRATSRKKYSGDSDPLLIVVTERSFQAGATTEGEYVVQEGDTWESIAAALGTTTDALHAVNPDLGDLTPGSSLRIPPPPEGDGAGDSASPVPPEDVADTPHVDAPAPPPPAAPGGGTAPGGGGTVPAVPAPPAWWGTLPLPGETLCLLRPAVCARPVDLLPPPPHPAPSGVDVEPTSGCGLDVLWTDESEDETGFLLYRITNRPRFHFDLLETFPAAAGSGTRLRYLDADPPHGSFFYSVVAYNAGGNTWSAPSAEYTSEGCPTTPGTQALVVEALNMNLVGGYDRAYCYASLADAPFERVPTGASNFITHPGGTWNIAEYFSGENKRTVMVDAAGPLNITVECLAWRGEELVNLGRFTASHPPAEWDGRELRGQPADGAFLVSYRIDYSFHAADTAGAAAWPIVDPAFPAPFNLHQTDSWSECTRTADDLTTCASTDEPGLGWDYTPRPGEARPLRYQVYRRYEGGSVPVLYHTTTSPSTTAPLATRDCDVTTYYTVSAVVMLDPVTGEDVQSPMSEEFVIPPHCAALEITLNTLWVYAVDDAFNPCGGGPLDDCFYEAYGWLTFNGHRITWNQHCDPPPGGGCLIGGTPSYTEVGQTTNHNWSDFTLNHGDGWRRGNNIIRIPIRDGEPLVLRFQFIDHDDGSDDDSWCATSGRRTLVMADARSQAEWLAYDQLLTFDGSAGRAGNCLIDFHVRGIPAGAP
jgi:hypothetical protein